MYGYELKNGRLAVKRKEANRIRKIFRLYIEGNSLDRCAKECGLSFAHSQVKNILTNKKYMGNEFYPAIIDKETFQKAGEEIAKRTKTRQSKPTVQDKPSIATPKHFVFLPAFEKFENPFAQAEYIYSLIEGKVN